MTRTPAETAFLLHSISMSGLRSIALDGVKAAMHLYFEENTDADDLDPAFLRGMELVCELCYEDVYLIEDEVKAQITADTGRVFPPKEES